MSDCPRGEIRDLLPELVHGSLDPATRTDVERHVSACAECAVELELLRAARTVLSRAPAVNAARIAAAVVAGRQSSARAMRSRERVWRVAALAAAIALMVMGAYWLASARRPSAEVVVTPPEVAPESATIVPALPAEVAVAMSFGEGQLEDAELEALLADIRSLDALPDEEPSDLLEVPAVNGEVQ